MSKGVPISQRPDMKDASLSARLDAVFGSLGPAAGSGGWSLRQDVQPFKAGGGIEEYNYSSDEEDPQEGLKPLMPSRLLDSDDEDNGDDVTRDGLPPLERPDPDADAEDSGFGCEQNENRAARERARMRATLSSRRAFEAEAEEDEFDRVATGTMDLRNRLVDAKPPGFTEVPLESAWERMHGRRQQQSDEQQQQDIIMPDAKQDSEPSVSPITAPQMNMGISLVAAATSGVSTSSRQTSRKRSRSESAGALTRTQTEQQQQQLQRGGDMAKGDVEIKPPIAVGGGADLDTPGDALVRSSGDGVGITTDTGGGSLGGTSESATVTAAPAPPRQRGGRRVQWADFVASGRSSGVDSTPNGVDKANGPNGHAHTANGSRDGRGGGSGDDGGGRGRGRGGSRVRLDWQRRGFVPDHVRNPHKYTLYTLDEELVVGGGDQSTNGRNSETVARSGEEGEVEMRQALAQARQAVEATSRAEHDPERAGTTFGSGIAFRPRTARQPVQATDEPPWQSANDAGMRASGEPNSELRGLRRGAFIAGGNDGDSPGDGEGSHGIEPFSMNGCRGGTRRGGGQRHFRARPRQVDEDGYGGGAGADGSDAMQQD